MGKAAKEERLAGHERAFGEGKERVERGLGAAARGDAEGFAGWAREMRAGSRGVKSLPVRFQVQLVRCKGCASGQVELVTRAKSSSEDMALDQVAALLKERVQEELLLEDSE